MLAVDCELELLWDVLCVVSCVEKLEFIVEDVEGVVPGGFVPGCVFGGCVPGCVLGGCVPGCVFGGG